MTDSEITTLAREYAEEMRKDILPFFPRPLPESMEVLVKADQEKVERGIRFLLRRYCLVEKSNVEEEYKKACESVNKHSATTGCLFFVGQKQTLESLFPEIAKEVEE